MTFLNPWGLLALLAVPIILGLHFFRQQRKRRQIGGLHLWDFARIATPAGRQFQRLQSSLPLLFQLLAAVLLALLIARLDKPLRQEARTFTIVLDDSVSMTAMTGGKSAAERAVEQISKWAPAGDKFTLVVAGQRPAVAVGPAADRDELLDFLERWTPSSDFAAMDHAVNIARKFIDGDGKLVVMTDEADGATTKPVAGQPLRWSTGQQAENRAIVFADRFRVSDDQERIVATVQRFGGGPGNGELAVWQGDERLLSRALDFVTTDPVTVQLDFSPTTAPLRLEISPADALIADNSAILQPAVVQPVRVFVAEDLTEAESFNKAALAVPDVTLVAGSDEADLVFAWASDSRLTTAMPGAGVAGRNALRIYEFARRGDETTGALRVAEGRDLLLSDGSPLTENLMMEGVLWPFGADVEANAAEALRADVAYTSIPLLYREHRRGNADVYRVNLALERSNITRHTAWPVLMMNIIEECREALPGISRRNLRSGEALRLNLDGNVDDGSGSGVSLWRVAGAPGEKGERLQTWTAVPEVLSGLERGSYALRRGEAEDGELLENFTVNLFNATESDLTAKATHRPGMDQLEGEAVPQTQQNFLIFYGLLVGLIACVALGWVYQDAGH